MTLPDRLPDTKDALVLRTDFSDAAAWDAIRDTVTNPTGEFRAYVEFVSDPHFDGVSVEQVQSLSARSAYRNYMFVVDHTALTHPDHPILVIDLIDEPGRTFRVIPSEMWGVENNLSLSNMDFHEFAESADDDGIFRGFPA
jgi:hypothetical protein